MTRICAGTVQCLCFGSLETYGRHQHFVRQSHYSARLQHASTNRSATTLRRRRLLVHWLPQGHRHHRVPHSAARSWSGFKYCGFNSAAFWCHCFSVRINDDLLFI